MRSSNLTKITTAIATPQNPAELNETILQVVNALRGVHGSGEWDGGIGGIGSWCKYSAFWDAKLSFDKTQTITIELPFTAINTILKVYHINNLTSVVTIESVYLSNSKTVTFGAFGKTLIELSLVQSAKE
jgi:hypothetical protein